MLSPKLRRQVFSLWTLFWSSGMTNPLVSIEQITYLLFLQQLEQLDRDRTAKGCRSIYEARSACQLPHPEGDGENCPGHATCRWSYIVQMPSYDHISQYVFPWLRVIDKILIETEKTRADDPVDGDQTAGAEEGFLSIGGQMDDAYFQFPREKTASLDKAIQRIDKLFQGGNIRSANLDLMGDIFEYLLSEIQTAGKNGQFRTPRHIIRLMIALLDPDVEQRMVDPAAGTLGFPINTIQHLRAKYTDPESLLLEWDGTPHRADGARLQQFGPDAAQRIFNRDYFTGYDNDRTMVRIGWMNMILHGIENPRVVRRDTLGKSLPESESGAYAYAEANPPFTGTVDKDDLHPTRFPVNPRNAKEPITNKSELLFVWLILDLLESSGRAAVIVPEGVLFGSTGAHRELRRQLLFDNLLEAVISLPGGVFQPYTGVKTSILVFQKYAMPTDDLSPRTEQVWFYEITADGYTPDAKRDDQPEPNDLWDLLEKWDDKVVDSRDYYQPRFYDVRWRVVDDDCLKVFPELDSQQGQTLGIDERHRELPADPQAATEQVTATQKPRVIDLYDAYVRVGQVEAQRAFAAAKTVDRGRSAVRSKLDARLRQVNRWFNDAIKQWLEAADYEDGDRTVTAYQSDRFGFAALTPVLEAGRQAAATVIAEIMAQIEGHEAVPQTEAERSADTDAAPAPGTEDAATAPDATNTNWQAQVDAIVKEFAKLDGYNVKLRTQEVYKQPDALSESKSWAAPVRTFAVDDAWELRVDDEMVLTGSHDDDGNVRPEYLDYLRTERAIFASDGTVKAEFLSLLDPDCIEANDLNLSAGRYKPFTLAAVQHDPPAQIISELQEMENEIQSGLAQLLAMVGGSDV